MLTINHIDELRSKVSHKEEIRENSVGDGQTCFCYMIAGDGTFDDAHSRECRGIVFDINGKVSGRPLHKFFNVNEREETQAHKLDWTKVVRVMDKRDGSMINTVRSVVNDAGNQLFRVKSKKSFDSDVALAANRLIYENNNYISFCRDIAAQDCTAIFEYTSPEARIVLYYPKAELSLLHIRNNVTGEYWTAEQLYNIANTYDIKVVDEPKFDVPKEQLGQHLLELAKTVKDIEGWVVQFEGGEMVKLKTAWYMERHRAMTFLRERDIAELVMSQGLDDLKSLLVSEGVDIKEIFEIESRVIEDIRGIERSLNTLVSADDFKMPRKEFVLKHRESAGPLFGLLMNKYSGKTLDYVDYFKDHMFKQNYSLRQLNLIPSVAEAE